ncbi:hypothetical protein SPSIL_028580 [Sporomusa silvacetica DSM 10669]|uniref:Uncharacterized protein n=1 Tax=Sporomusa silvacetica DSM 10669 TaxID=1123289 RepID=A0ABZ3ILX0_9FIRM|nr:hypothetical protein SPSIL_02870 [Sporomusa silvacetica DSM 10669]
MSMKVLAVLQALESLQTQRKCLTVYVQIEMLERGKRIDMETLSAYEISKRESRVTVPMKPR